MKAVSTFYPFNALASINAILFDYANSTPDSYLTARKCFKSDLFPIIITTVSLSALSLTSFNQRSKFSKLY